MIARTMNTTDTRTSSCSGRKFKLRTKGLASRYSFCCRINEVRLTHSGWGSVSSSSVVLPLSIRVWAGTGFDTAD